MPAGKPTNVGKSTVTGKPTGKPAANTMAGKPADKHAEAIQKVFTQINGGGVEPAGKPTTVGATKKGQRVSATPRPQ